MPLNRSVDCGDGVLKLPNPILVAVDDDDGDVEESFGR